KLYSERRSRTRWRGCGSAAELESLLNTGRSALCCLFETGSSSLSQTVTAVPSTAAERLAAVRREIAAACREAKRDPASVTLVAISKTFGVEAIASVVAAGQTVFGENRVQEAKAKWPALKAQHPGLELHLVGPLQSNKAKEA